MIFTQTNIHILGLRCNSRTI